MCWKIYFFNWRENATCSMLVKLKSFIAQVLHCNICILTHYFFPCTSSSFLSFCQNDLVRSPVLFAISSFPILISVISHCIKKCTLELCQFSELETCDDLDSWKLFWWCIRSVANSNISESLHICRQVTSSAVEQWCEMEIKRPSGLAEDAE